MQIGDSLPRLTLPATSNHTINLANLVGQPRVIVFYPRDDTLVRTQEGENFRDHLPNFSQTSANFGISRDSVKSHEKFKSKHRFSV
ncbi:MAG: redoxin domain-containing protein [Thiotrichaceae bacterium]